jgi:hypothetical protein
MYGNTGGGIALTNGGNDDQPAPVINSAFITPLGLTVTGTIAGVGGYKGPFQVQVFSNPASDAGNVQGRQFLGTANTTTNEFLAQFPGAATVPGNLVTVVVTPSDGVANSSEFSAPATVT